MNSHAAERRPVALVTGSTSGIGEGIARRLAAAGFRVVINSRSSADAGRRIAHELGGFYAQGDIALPTTAEEVVHRSVRLGGRLDLLVNNAATTVPIPHADLRAVTPEVWKEILDTNLVGPWSTARAAGAYLAESPNGHIVNISSLGGARPIGSSVPYAASKAALDHLTRLLANALGPRIRVNAIAPGYIATSWTERIPALWNAASGNIPLDRPGSPADVGEAVLGLHRMAYVTGVVLPVDGGRHLRY